MQPGNRPRSVTQTVDPAARNMDVTKLTGIIPGVSTAQWEITTPGELSACELARWESLRSSGPSLESPFLSGAFATHVGAVRRDARVAVHRAHGSDGIGGFLPFHSGPTR